MIATFGVRNCKIRGVLIESMTIEGNNDVFFFKYHNQNVTSHCIEIQNIMRAVDVKRSRKVKVDISEFCHEYYDPERKAAWFKGILLESSYKELNRTMNKRINIDAGVEKRKQTINDNKAAKAEEKQNKFEAKNAYVEKLFQEERAKRIHALMAERQNKMDST